MVDVLEGRIRRYHEELLRANDVIRVGGQPYDVVIQAQIAQRGLTQTRLIECQMGNHRLPGIDAMANAFGTIHLYTQHHFNATQMRSEPVVQFIVDSGVRTLDPNVIDQYLQLIQ